MLVRRLSERFGYDNPIFADDILDCMKDYSRQRVYQLISDAVDRKTLVRFDTGVYYLPTETEFGRSVISVNDVVRKKYIEDGGKRFGIYGKYVIDLNFLLSSQVPNTIEVITNREARDVREIQIRNRRVILRKSRTVITNQNSSAYTLMELFNGIDLERYKSDAQVRQAISDYISQNQINGTTIYGLADAFPARTMKKLAVSGVLDEITRK